MIVIIVKKKRVYGVAPPIVRLGEYRECRVVTNAVESAPCHEFCSSNTTCHAPTLAVLFQPHYRRCNTTKTFIFKNTNDHKLCLLSILSVFSTAKHIFH